MFRILLIAVAAIGLAAGGAFVAGTTYGKRAAATTAPAAQSLIASGPAAGALAGSPDHMVRVAPGGPNGAIGSGPNGVTGAFGTVSRVDGRTVYLSSPDGRETRVTLTDSTRIEKQAEGTPSDLKPGTTVAVMAEGQPAADGALTAANVSIMPANAVRFESAAPGGTPVPAGSAGSAGAVQPRQPGR
ncbi:MAG TPA: hypothetical protein VNA89_05480 [Gemmatimonadaceae bacterium]|nr:hypothetical protein [Gemmatimonadaceae bacterium]